MKKLQKLNNKLIYICTDQVSNTKKFYQQVELILQAGIDIFQLRDKTHNFQELLIIAKKLKDLCKKYHTYFIINDYLMLAKELDADGVHLGQDDEKINIARKLLGNDKIIGISCSNIEQFKKINFNLVDYIGLGSIFPTKTKKDATIISQEDLVFAINNSPIPCVLIGGLNLTNINDLKSLHASSFAFISQVWQSKNIVKTIKELVKIIKE